MLPKYANIIFPGFQSVINHHGQNNRTSFNCGIKHIFSSRAI